MKQARQPLRYILCPAVRRSLFEKFQFGETKCEVVLQICNIIYLYPAVTRSQKAGGHPIYFKGRVRFRRA